jgi:hypothetical protein
MAVPSNPDLCHLHYKTAGLQGTIIFFPATITVWHQNP